MSTRQILAEVETERQAQDNQHGGPAHDDLLNWNDFIAIAVRHLGLACNDEAKIDLARFRKQMIRVATVCVAAVESLDREQEYEHGAGRPVSERGPEY